MNKNLILILLLMSIVTPTTFAKSNDCAIVSTRVTFLEKNENRKTVTVAMNLLFGAAVATRVNWLRHQRISLPQGAVKYQALELDKIL